MPALFAESFSIDSRKIDIPIQIATLSIICFNGSQVDFPNKYVLQPLKIAFIIANGAEPDEMQITKTTVLGVSNIQRLYSTLSDEFNQIMPLGRKVAHPLGQMFRLT